MIHQFNSICILVVFIQDPVTDSQLEDNRRKIQASFVNQPLLRTSVVHHNHQLKEQAVNQKTGFTPGFRLDPTGRLIYVHNLIGNL